MVLARYIAIWGSIAVAMAMHATASGLIHGTALYIAMATAMVTGIPMAMITRSMGVKRGLLGILGWVESVTRYIAIPTSGATKYVKMSSILTLRNWLKAMAPRVSIDGKSMKRASTTSPMKEADSV